jgi:tetratricopeptide (TPR) repeat protein
MLLLFIISCKKENNIQNTHTSTLTSNPFLKRAKAFRKKNISDSAFYYFNLAKNSFLEKGDSLGAGRSLVNMGILQTENGDFLGGIESSLEADKYIKQKKDSNVLRTLSANYNNLGIASNYLKYQDKSIEYYIKAINTAVDQENKYIYYNNIGDILTTQGKYEEAINYLEKAILSKNNKDYSMALNNLAKAKYLFNKNYNPLPEFNRALEIRKKDTVNDGLNSSFETLSTYYLNKDKSLSLDFAKKMLQAATNNKSPDDQILALQRIIILDPKNYLTNFQKFNFINDSLQIARNNNKNQFAFFRYDVDKKNKEYQNLKLRDAEKEVQIFRQYFLVIALIIAIIFITIWYRRRQLRLKQEKELEVKNTQLKMSKKVHDVVANGIYQVMTKIENQEHFDKDEALDELEFVYEKSRDISYEKMDSKNDEKDFSEKISELVGSFKNETVNTYTAGNEKEIWENVKESIQEEVYQIVRELLVNMKKHSKADRVVFRFERENNLIKIFYTDNGIGISGDLIYKNGLSSTVSRIETIAGEIIFDTKIEKGLKINISFPAH